MNGEILSTGSEGRLERRLTGRDQTIGSPDGGGRVELVDEPAEGGF
jgi:hypothetical protein